MIATELGYGEGIMMIWLYTSIFLWIICIVGYFSEKKS